MEDFYNAIVQKPDSIVAICALFVSIITVILTIITAISNRKNNRLSVRPLAYILPLDYEDRIAVILQNKGTGPLIVNQVKFVDLVNNIEKKYLIDHLPQLLNGYFWKNFSKASKIVLSPNEDKILVDFTRDIQDPKFIQQRDLIRQSLSNIEIQIKYTSIFKEWFSFELKYKLKWYKRVK